MSSKYAEVVPKGGRGAAKKRRLLEQAKKALPNEAVVTRLPESASGA